MRNVAKVSRKRFEMEFFNFSSPSQREILSLFLLPLSLLLSFRLKMGLLGGLKFINFKSRGTRWRDKNCGGKGEIVRDCGRVWYSFE